MADNLASLLRRHSQISRLDLSREIGVGDGTLGRILYARDGNPRLASVCRIADFFGIAPWELLLPERDAGEAHVPPPAPQARRIRISLMEAPAGGSLGASPFTGVGHVEVSAPWATARLGNDLGLIRAVPVMGDAMAPTFIDGDLLLVDTGVRQVVIDGVYVIGAATAYAVRRLSVDPVGQVIDIRCDNPGYPPRSLPCDRAEDLRVVGRVRASISTRGL